MNFKWSSFVKNRFDRTVFTGLPLTIFILVLLILLGTLVGITDAIVNSAPIVKTDLAFANFLYAHRTPTMARALYIITNFADQLTIILLGAGALAYFYFKKEIAYLYSLVLVFAGSEISAYLLKISVGRARPLAQIAYYVEDANRSFPSGHATSAMAIYGFLTYYLVRHTKFKYKNMVAVIGVLLIGLIGFSRLYLGVHFLSDVVAGFLMGGLWLVIGMIFRERHFYVAGLKKGVSS